MLATFLLVAMVHQTCGDCGLVDMRVRLCAKHTAEERAALLAARKPLVSKVEAERMAALETLARLTESHTNAPSEKVARCLGNVLEDPSAEVRASAAQLLGPPQHALASMQALLDALTAVDRDLEKSFRESEKLQRKKWSGGVPEKRADRYASDLADSFGEQEELRAWRRILVEQLALFPDAGVVKALRAFGDPLVAAPGKARKIADVMDMLAAYRLAAHALPAAMDVNPALVRLGSRDAIQAVIANLTVLREGIAELEGWDSFSEVATPLLSGLTAERTRCETEIAEILKGKSFEEPPPDSSTLDVLIDWLQQNVELFPEELPGVISPVW